MRIRNTLTWIALWSCAVLLAGCEASCTTAHFGSARMSKDPDGNQPTTVYAPGDTFYCVATMANVPSDTDVRCVFVAVETAGQQPNRQIAEKTIEGGDGLIKFNCTLPNPWPVGKYRTDLYINGKLQTSVPFTVAAAGG